MPRRKTTVYLDRDLLDAVRVLSASSGRHDYEVMEEAIRLYLGRPEAAASRQRVRDLFDRIAARSNLRDEAALALAYEGVEEHRRSRHSAPTDV